MSKYIDTKKIMGNIASISHQLMVGKEGSPLNLNAINHMPKIDMKRWIESRYTRYDSSILTEDCLGFPLGYLDGIMILFFDPNTYIKGAYEQSDKDYKNRFNTVLSKELEERIDQFEHEKPIRENISYIHYGLEFIIKTRNTTLSDIPLTLVDPKYDLDIKGISDYSDVNLYFDSVLCLQALRLELPESFWDEIAQDPRLIMASILAPSSPDEQVKKAIKYRDKIEEDNLFAVFWIYCYEDNGKKFNNTKEMGLRRLIEEEAGENRNYFLSLLERF